MVIQTLTPLNKIYILTTSYICFNNYHYAWVCMYVDGIVVYGQHLFVCTKVYPSRTLHIYYVYSILVLYTTYTCTLQRSILVCIYTHRVSSGSKNLNWRLFKIFLWPSWLKLKLSSKNVHRLVEILQFQIHRIYFLNMLQLQLSTSHTKKNVHFPSNRRHTKVQKVWSTWNTLVHLQ